MPLFELRPFAPPREPGKITVEVTREATRLQLMYRLEGPAAARVRWPQAAGRPFSRREGLWESTCFELFLKIPEDSGYSEWNFSPSLEWMHYSFSAPRTRDESSLLAGGGLADLELQDSRPQALGLRVNIDLSFDSRLAWLAHHVDARFEAALTAVLETKDGQKSYWALEHASEKPDFHNLKSFIARI